MKHRSFFALALSVLITISLFVLDTPATADSSAAPTVSSVLVDGERVSFEAYNINSNNYFKLRDLAYVLRASKKQFSLKYDDKNDAIILTSDSPYTPIGGELVKKQSGTRKTSATSSLIYKDGAQFILMAYTIDGNNYFKLRDIAAVFDFGIGWDQATNSITIATDEKYEMPKATGTTPYLNTYYLMSVGMTVSELNSRFGAGSENLEFGIITYPQGFYIATDTPTGVEITADAICKSMNGNVSLLICNCPAQLRLSQIRTIFGSADVKYSDYDDSYYVIVPYAGQNITLDSDSKGSVSSNGKFNFNPITEKPSVSSKANYSYAGKWSFGAMGEYSSENNYTALNLRNITKDSLSFDLEDSRSASSFADNVRATSTDGIVYTAAFSDSWYNDCTAKITLKDGRVFLEAVTVRYDPNARYGMDFIGELFQ